MNDCTGMLEGDTQRYITYEFFFKRFLETSIHPQMNVIILTNILIPYIFVYNQSNHIQFCRLSEKQKYK
jgi:hypothetical protein